VGLGFGALIAVLLQVAPGAFVARIARLTWPVAISVGPALTYGVVAAAIVPFGATGIAFNAATAALALAVVAVLAAGLRAFPAGYRDDDAASPGIAGRPAILVAGGVLLGAALIGYAALRGMPFWQTIPSTWDAVWHANTVRFILDTGQASPTHMGELRNVETHEALYYPSAFHALTAVYCQLTGAAPTSAYTLMSLAASAWLFPVSAAVLTWRLSASAIAAATGAVLAASFTAVPYVEFGTAAMPNLVAYGLAVPTFALITSTPAHRDRIGVAVLALLGVLTVHLTGGIVVALLVAAWWLLEALRHPVRGRLADVSALAGVAAAAVLVFLPQLLAVRKQSEVIAGHSFPSFRGKKLTFYDALVQHTRHLNDFPVQYTLIGLAAVGAVVLLVKKIYWPVALWAVLVVAIVHSGAALGGRVGAVLDSFTNLFYSDPRRLSAAVTLLLTPMAAIALVTIVAWAAAAAKRVAEKFARLPAPVFSGGSAVVLVATTVGLAVHYLPRHEVLLGDKYDSVIIDDNDLAAFAYLARLPEAKDTLIGNANTDGTAWMYAVADLHPLWTHYDYPQQTGPGYHRFTFWAHAGDGDDPRVAETLRALDIRYVLISSPTVRGFTLPDGLLSLEHSTSWVKLYDNGGACIYEWRGHEAAPHDENTVKGG
jgi:hypothetical protein